MFGKICAIAAKVDNFFFWMTGKKPPPRSAFKWRNRTVSAFVLVVAATVAYDYSQHGLPPGQTVQEAITGNLIGLSVLWLASAFLWTLCLVVLYDTVCELFAIAKAVKENFIPACKALWNGSVWLFVAIVRAVIGTPAAIWFTICWLARVVAAVARAIIALPAAVGAMTAKQWEGVVFAIGMLGSMGGCMYCLWHFAGRLAYYVSYANDTVDLWAHTLMIDMLMSVFCCLPIVGVWMTGFVLIMHFCIPSTGTK